MSSGRGAGVQYGRWMVGQARVLAATNTDLGAQIRIRVLYPAGSLGRLTGGFSHTLYDHIGIEIGGDEHE